MSNRMLLRLFALPVLLLILAGFGLYFLGEFLPHWFSGSTMFESLGTSSRAAVPWVVSGLLLAALAFFTVGFYRLWRWDQGKSDCCFICGGIVDNRHGRYGHYKHCLACGKNQKI